MKRYSKAHLARHPEDRGKDLEITRRACEKFRDLPVTVVNFLEGTRFTPQKHQAQASPYQHLLRPKSGGIAFVTAALGEQMRSLLDVTIIYPQQKPPGFWALISGRVPRVLVDIRSQTLPSELFHGDYSEDPAFRAYFQDRVNALWAAKDQRIAELRNELRSAESGS